MKKMKNALIVIAVVVLLFCTGVIKIDINITSGKETQTTMVSSNAAVVDAKETEAAKEKGSDAGVSKEVKEFWNSYEAFVDEYCEFAKNYDASDFHSSVDAIDYMNTAMDFMVKADKYDEDKMSDTDAKFVSAVRERVETKLAEVNTEMNTNNQ